MEVALFPKDKERLRQLLRHTKKKKKFQLAEKKNGKKTRVKVCLECLAIESPLPAAIIPSTQKPGTKRKRSL